MEPTYHEYVKQILVNGIATNPRNLDTIEGLNHRLMFMPGETVLRSNTNYALGFVEACQIIGGVFSVDSIKAVAPNSRLELFTNMGAYGPRLVNQIPKIIETLQEDPQSRRAVVFFSTPDQIGTEDLACTISMQWVIRRSALFSTVCMRSSDAIYGITYDIVQFGALSMALAHVLGVQVGPVNMNLMSAHIYNATVKLLPRGTGAGRNFTLAEGLPRTWPELQTIACSELKVLETGTWEDKIPHNLFRWE